ncbi:MAG: hypothetical protein LBT59_28965 [Clostridiales bacterium]|nr:hypothetical protein [Clostridiales bacterium]
MQPDYSYLLINLDFLSIADFSSESGICAKLYDLMLSQIEYVSAEDGNAGISTTGILRTAIQKFAQAKPNAQLDLINAIQDMCQANGKRIVLAIDGIDKACDSQPFIDFLSGLRDLYIHRKPLTFISVILAGVNDPRNPGSRPDPNGGSSGIPNIPWNIATDFAFDMNLTLTEISGMLSQYEADHNTSMDIPLICGLLKEYTDGYPFLVSKLCALMDTVVSENNGGSEKMAWSREGFLEAVRLLLREHSLLPFQSLVLQVENNSELKDLLKRILLTGMCLNCYTVSRKTVDQAIMNGLMQVLPDSCLTVSNRIYETYLYNILMHDGLSFGRNAGDDVADAANALYGKKNTKDAGIAFIQDQTIDMGFLIKRFSAHYSKEFRPRDKASLENQARRLFLTFLKPILNGQGNYYIDSQTRSVSNADLVVDMFSKRHIVKLKIWDGAKLASEEIDKFADYLDRFGLETGYLLVFYVAKRRNRKGSRELRVNGKKIVLFEV